MDSVINVTFHTCVIQTVFQNENKVNFCQLKSGVTRVQKKFCWQKKLRRQKQECVFNEVGGEKCFFHEIESEYLEFWVVFIK